jgi:uncharacterized membrane protein
MDDSVAAGRALLSGPAAAIHFVIVGSREIVIALLASCLSSAQSSAEHFETRVRPVLAAKCQGCHGVDEASGGLRLNSGDGMLAGGKRGPAIALNAPESSLLVRAVRHEGGLAMPPGGAKLREGEVAAIAGWIAGGAVWPAGAEAAGPRAWPTGTIARRGRTGRSSR